MSGIAWDSFETLRILHDQMRHTSCAAWKDKSRETYRARGIAQCAFEDAQRNLVKEFAIARGWIIARHHFTVEQLAQGRAGRYFSRDYRGEHHERRALDHPEHFRFHARPFRPAGIVVHVYADDYTLCKQLAARHGLTFEPLPWSWYYPGGARAGVYTGGTPAGRIAR